MRCEKARQEILDRTLQSREIPAGSPLDLHLKHCRSCSAFLERVIEVDAALQLLPIESAPPEMLRHVRERIASLPTEPAFLPWTLWVPAASFFFGLIWAYLILLWQRWPFLAEWPAQLEQWLGGHQLSLGAVTLSISLGMIFTMLGIALGLYIGRKGRVARINGV